jgi:3D (Asp-Asp-Asp) domain-containing protein
VKAALAGSLWRRAMLTAIAAAAFVSLYEVTMFDSENAARRAEARASTAVPTPGARLTFTARAYCKGDVTASGVAPQTGIAAADPALLPVGSVIQIGSLATEHDGVYTILDTGPAVRGREIDVYMWSCNKALEFGRHTIHVTVLRLGWNPRATVLK